MRFERCVHILAIYALTLCASIPASSSALGVSMGDSIPQSVADWAAAYRAPGILERERCAVRSYVYDSVACRIFIDMNDIFGSQQWRRTTPELIYSQVRSLIPEEQRHLPLTIRTLGYPIEQLAPYSALDSVPRLHTIDYKGVPWIRNLSRPYSFQFGLANRHLVVSASHGKYWNTKRTTKKGRKTIPDPQWDWQRPLLNDVREDLLTPSITNEFLIPMLENAGAIVWTPRERCASTTELIVDNDISDSQHYIEVNGSQQWQDAGEGFAPISTIVHGLNPFTLGTARVVAGTKSATATSQITWFPEVTENERLAVYVSYKSFPESTENAVYLVRHAGVDTYFAVNQRMGGSTWVYLGEFLFTADEPMKNCVVLTNKNSDGGLVSADAVRFGGGWGNTVRGIDISGEPRYNEGARYSMQWAGIPDSIYSLYQGEDDYKDDINVRSLAANLMTGGSVYNPDAPGKGVPLELCVATHTDAGVAANGGIMGSLGIATTHFNDGLLAEGCSRLLSRDLAEEVLSSVSADMEQINGVWQRRQLWDRNYSETRLPAMPSTIIEMLSHENPADVEFITDSLNRFHMARAIYKGILRFVYRSHALGNPIVQPLPVSNLKYENGMLSWQPATDPLEPSAAPTHYLVQLARLGCDYDNGTLIATPTAKINADDIASVRIYAINAGGASLPTILELK